MLPIGIRTAFEDLPAALALGFDYMEISISELEALPQTDFEDFCAYADEVSLPLRVGCDMLPKGMPVTGAGVSSRTLHGYLTTAFARAKRLGISQIVFDAPKARSVPSDGDFPTAWRQLGNFLRLCQSEAFHADLTVLIEPIRKADCDLLNLVSEATLMNALLQLDHVAVMANLGHMAMTSEPLQSLRRAMPYLEHIHIEGALDRSLKSAADPSYARMLRSLTDIGYRGGVTLVGETEDFERDAKQALKALRVMLC